MADTGGFVGSHVATALTVQEGAPAAARKVRKDIWFVFIRHAPCVERV